MSKFYINGSIGNTVFTNKIQVNHTHDNETISFEDYMAQVEDLIPYKNWLNKHYPTIHPKQKPNQSLIIK